MVVGVLDVDLPVGAGVLAEGCPVGVAVAVAVGSGGCWVGGGAELVGLAVCDGVAEGVGVGMKDLHSGR